MIPEAVVKVGGGLIEGEALPGLLETLVELSTSHRLLVVPGGGPFADAVRAVDARLAPGESTAHWMAVLAMEQSAHLLAGLAARSALLSGPDQLAACWNAQRLPVLAPFAWLRAEDPLPHGWHVTSDSLAAWIARTLRTPLLVLVKVVDGVSKEAALRAEASVAEATTAGVVDPYLSQALSPETDCWLVNGRRPERIAELIRTGRTTGTRLRRE